MAELVPLSRERRYASWLELLELLLPSPMNRHGSTVALNIDRFRGGSRPRTSDESVRDVKAEVALQTIVKGPVHNS